MSRGVGMPMVEENVVQLVGPWGARSHVCVGKKIVSSNEVMSSLGSEPPLELERQC